MRDNGLMHLPQKNYFYSAENTEPPLLIHDTIIYFINNTINQNSENHIRISLPGVKRVKIILY